MNFTSEIVPAVVILVANLLGGRHGSVRWEYVTAVFGWVALASLPAALLVTAFAHDSWSRHYLWQLSGFSFITALSRDYEELLRPLFSWNRE